MQLTTTETPGTRLKQTNEEKLYYIYTIIQPNSQSELSK